MAGTWSPDWAARRDGADCPACTDGRPEQDDYGVRIYAGEHADAYLQRAPIRPGHTVVVWRGRHVAEPTELNAEELSSYGREVLKVGSALGRHYQPAKMNYLTFGNAMPHLHTHIVPRPWDDSEPGRPFTFRPDVPELAEGDLLPDVEALRGLL